MKQTESDHILLQNKIKLLQAIILSDEKERVSMSEELHENVAQLIAAVKLHISLSKDHITEEGLPFLMEAQRLLEESLIAVRQVSRTLSPISLTTMGLTDLIDDLMNLLHFQNDIQYHIDVDEEAVSHAQIEVLNLFYRVIQLQVINILKLKLSTSKNKLKLELEDNGTGTDLKKLKYGTGFHAIQQRTEVFNGSFKIESEKSKPGFKIIVEV
jgi:signal transduction histidine kinase